MVEAAHLAARAFRDNPMTVACWGRDATRRERGVYVLFREYLPSLAFTPWIATQNGAVVAVLGAAPPGTCLHTPLGPTVRVLGSMLLRGPATMNRFRQWMLRFEYRDPSEPHWHLGPVAVEPALQHCGIGSALLDRFCTAVDEDEAAAYLETDTAQNEQWYTRFGFQTIDQEPILGVQNWFMLRSARTSSVGGTVARDGFHALR